MSSGFDRTVGVRSAAVPDKPDRPAEPVVVLRSGPEHTRIVYRLRAIPATDACQTITALLRQEGELRGSGDTAPKGGPALRVAITPDTVINSLVISGPPAAVEEVRLLAEKMDQPAAMVQLDAEIGEVPAGTALHGEALPSEGKAPAAERPAVFRVLERPKAMKTIVHARLLALDNQPAFVQLGQRIPQVTGVNKSSFGTSQSVTMQNLGSILAVTPRVNVKEGTVVFQVDVEDSQLGPEDEGVPIHSNGDKVVRTPRTDVLTVQTTVQGTDGKAILLGSVARQGKTGTELVVILTPHIIPPEETKK